jgi:hypothetical protein
MDDHLVYGQIPRRPEPPKEPSLLGYILVVAFVLIIITFGVYACSASAHMHDRPDLDAWFNGLQSSGGYPCCSEIDGSTVAGPDWDTTVIDGKSHYRVRVEGQWVVVTDSEVVNGPNKYGQPLVWVYHTCDGNTCKPAVRCFMVGAGG